jgi:pimeloyl-ACP methyl ester carboxylesterase
MENTQLFLLHGALGSSAQMKPLADHFEDGIRIILHDFPGHGEKPTATEFSVEAFAEDVLEEMNTRGIQKAGIFGYSMGGYVALYLAKHHPDRVSRVWTLSTKVEWNHEQARRETEALHPKTLREKNPEFVRKLSETHGEGHWEKLLAQTASMMTGLGDHPLLSPKELSGIEVPVTVSTGDRDKMVNIEETIRTFRLLKNGRLMILPGTGHAFERADFALLASHLRTFFY